MEQVEFRAMGSTCRIVVDGGPIDVVDRARQMVDKLERSWTRFDDRSEVSAVNTNAGNYQLVSADTYTLFDHAVVARRETGDRFHPLMLEQLAAHGYSSTWASGTTSPNRVGISPGTNERISLLPDVRGVRIPRGCAFDPGGIGKGLCADLVTDFLKNEGVSTSSVELGGDLRVYGRPWYGPRWRIAVADPFIPDAEVGAFTPSDGAVATSSRLKKSWTAEGHTYHHLLDPRTGEPATTDLVSVSCCAATAWWAEVAAKVVLISGSANAMQLFNELGVHGLAVTEMGRVLCSGTNEQVSSTPADSKHEVTV